MTVVPKKFDSQKTFLQIFSKESQIHPINQLLPISFHYGIQNKTPQDIYIRYWNELRVHI